MLNSTQYSANLTKRLGKPNIDDVFANYLIGLREGLEAALVVSILVAYLVKVERRDRLGAVAGGVGVASAVSIGFGALLTYTSTSLLHSEESRTGFAGIMSVVAVGFVTGMIFWMRRTARTMRSDLDTKLSSALDVGTAAVAVTAFAAVTREGLETALFFWSAVQAAGSTVSPVLGFALGITTAVTLAWLLYRRSVKLNLARFFTWTGAALIVVAAGVLAYAMHDLQEAGILGGVQNMAFDVTANIPETSWYGSLLKGFFNFDPHTTWLQLLTYVGYLIPVMVLFFRRQRPIKRSSGSTGPTKVMSTTGP